MEDFKFSVYKGLHSLFDTWSHRDKFMFVLHCFFSYEFYRVVEKYQIGSTDHQIESID